MSLTTLKQLRDHVATVVRETQQSDLIDAFLNETAQQIFNAHPWTWKRRKTSFSTVTSQEDYNLDSEVDEIAFLRQTTSPAKLIYLPDHLFYKVIPNPESLSTSTPRYYRRWEATGFSTNLAADDTVYINSSSASDGSSFTVRIRGRNSSGEIIEETLTLNGTSNVTSATTWDAAGLLQISKSGTTTGTISCYRTTGDTLLSEMEPSNLAPRFLRISLYPIPSAVITMYLEYYERFRPLIHNTDVPQMDHKYNWILLEGTFARMWEYKQNETAVAQHQAIYDRGLKAMIAQDSLNLDYVPVLQSRAMSRGVVARHDDSVGNAFPVYSVGVP